MGYDAAPFNSRKTAISNLAAAANGTKGVFFSYQKFILRAAHFRNSAAGTTTGAAAGFTIRNGTTSLGSCVFSTNAIATQSSVTGINAVFAGGATPDVLNCLGGADATLAADVAYEWEVLQDAAFN